MEMTNREIVKSYKAAGQTDAQIKRLSQLNACRIGVIEGILEEEGVYKRKVKKQPPKAEEKAVVQSIEIKIPAKITEILISRMEELEELIEELTNEHKEIRNFLGMEMR